MKAGSLPDWNATGGGKKLVLHSNVWGGGREGEDPFQSSCHNFKCHWLLLSPNYSKYCANTNRGGGVSWVLGAKSLCLLYIASLLVGLCHQNWNLISNWNLLSYGRFYYLLVLNILYKGKLSHAYPIVKILLHKTDTMYFIQALSVS